VTSKLAVTGPHHNYNNNGTEKNIFGFLFFDLLMMKDENIEPIHLSSSSIKCGAYNEHALKRQFTPK